jgi:putative peptide zinc metalloprotease protein
VAATHATAVPGAADPAAPAPETVLGAPLPPARRAALEGLRRGASPEALAERLGWSPGRVVREARAALMALEPERYAMLAPAEREQELARTLRGAPAAGDETARAGGATAAAEATAASPTAAKPEAVVLPERPARLESVLVEPGPADSDHCVVSDVRRALYLRIKRPQAELLARLDGSRTVDELAADPGVLEPRLVRPLLQRFAQIGLLEGTERPDTDRARRVRTADRTRIQFEVADPDALLDRARGLIRALGSPVALVTMLVILAAGLVAYGAGSNVDGLTGEFVGNPLVLGSVIVATVLTVMLHELAHAGAVKYHGGHVHRLGVMLFYVAPAMFCDTSDAWRFRRNGQRAVVSLAGIVAQLLVTALAGLPLLAPLGGDARAWITLFGIVNFGMCVLNAIPLVKLDGYWTLAALLDRPNLRGESVALAREHIRAAVFGLPRRSLPRLPAPLAHGLFGLACLLFAPLLVTSAVLHYQELLLGLGPLGAGLWLLLALLVAAGPARGLARAIQGAAAEGRGAAVRGAALVAVVLALAAAGATLVELPVTTEGDFRRLSARTVVVSLSETQRDRVRPGDRVRLTRGGLASSRTLARGRVVRAAGESGDVRVRLDRRVRLPRRGGAEVTGRPRPAPRWFADMYLAPPLRGLGL